MKNMQTKKERKRLDKIQRNIRIRVLFLGYSSVREFVTERHEELKGKIDVMEYHCWRALNSRSNLDKLVKAANVLGVTVGVLVGSDSPTSLLLVEDSSSRVGLSESGQE